MLRLARLRADLPAISVLALTLFSTVLGTAKAQEELSDDARRFLVYPAKKVTSFNQYEPKGYNLTYAVQSDRDSEVIVGIDKFENPEKAVEVCRQVADYDRVSQKNITEIGGYACAFVSVEAPNVNWANKPHTPMRRTLFVVGSYVGQINENPSFKARYAPYPVEPLLAALKGERSLTPAEIAFRNVLFSTGLKFRGDAARSCLDEVMNTAEATAAKDPKPKMADEIAQLRKAAAGAHAIEVLASVPVGPAHFDDFDPKWWDALKEVVPNPTSTPDPQDTATDRVIDLLPPPLNVLVNIVRTGSKTMRAIKTHVADPTVHREVYACYRRMREGSGGTPIGENIGQAALESEAAQILHDAIGAGCNAPNSFKNSYESQLRGFTSKEARENEFTRLLRPLAVRFEFIYRVEDAKAHGETLIAGRWAPVQDILERLKVRVNACIADRASKSR